MMSSKSGTEHTHKIDAVASDWLIRRQSGQWNTSDQARLDEWLNSSTLHRVAFLRLELAWEAAARLRALGAGIAGDRPWPPGGWNLTPFFDPQALESLDSDLSALTAEHANPSSAIEGARQSHDRGMALTLATTPSCATPWRPRRRMLALSAAAAVVLLVAVVGGIYLAMVPIGERHATPVGGLASVPMFDGSTVTLNTDSQISIALTDTERRVELGHGEAFFEVSKDPKRPFVVRAGDKRVIAVGTKFSVRRDGDDIEIVVTEGKVRVEDGAVARGQRASGMAEVFVTPGGIARAGEAGVLVQRRTLPEAEEQLSWRTGWLMFRNRGLADAIAEFNRYNVRKIVIRDQAIASLKIEGNFRATNVDAFVRLLENGFPVRAEVRGDQILLSAK
jgi:transmembrane sensor